MPKLSAEVKKEMKSLKMLMATATMAIFPVLSGCSGSSQFTKLLTDAGYEITEATDEEIQYAEDALNAAITVASMSGYDIGVEEINIVSMVSASKGLSIAEMVELGSDKEAKAIYDIVSVSGEVMHRKGSCLVTCDDEAYKVLSSWLD